MTNRVVKICLESDEEIKTARDNGFTILWRPKETPESIYEYFILVPFDKLMKLGR